MVDLLQVWVKKIKINDTKQVAELYHEKGLLLGTFSNIERVGKKLILDYFKNLFASRVDVKIITKNEFKTESTFIVSGLYNFLVDDKEIKARFSFVFLKSKDNWKILSHHSSVLPHKN